MFHSRNQSPTGASNSHAGTSVPSLRSTGSMLPVPSFASNETRGEPYVATSVASSRSSCQSSTRTPSHSHHRNQDPASSGVGSSYAPPSSYPTGSALTVA